MKIHNYLHVEYAEKTTRQTFSQRYFQRIVDAKTRQIKDVENQLRKLESQWDWSGPNHPSLLKEINTLKARLRQYQNERLKYLYRIS